MGPRRWRGRRKKSQEVCGRGRPVRGVEPAPRFLAISIPRSPCPRVPLRSRPPGRGGAGFRRLPPGATMPEETIDPGLLEQTKNQIRKLVAEIADLAESDIQPAEFHAEFLNRVVAAVAASGGALWLLDGRGSLKLQHQLEFRLTGLLDG